MTYHDPMVCFSPMSSSSPRHAYNARLDEETYSTASVIATATGQSVNSMLNDALAMYVDKVLDDPEVQEALEDSYARHQLVMARYKEQHG